MAGSARGGVCACLGSESVTGPRTFLAAAWDNSSPACMDFSALIALDVN